MSLELLLNGCSTACTGVRNHQNHSTACCSTRASVKSSAIPMPHGGTSATESFTKKKPISFDAGKLRTGLEVIAN